MHSNVDGYSKHNIDIDQSITWCVTLQYKPTIQERSSNIEKKNKSCHVALKAAKFHSIFDLISR